MELEVTGVAKQYKRGRVKALDSVSLTFTPGIYGLLGPNGAGKSTLLNILTGSLRADAGQVKWNGTEIAKIPLDYRKILGYAPQHQGLYEEFTANRFLWYLAALKGIPKKEAAKEIQEVLQVVGLSDQQNRRLGTFSGGMKQRILIAQALLGNPQLYEEFTANRFLWYLAALKGIPKKEAAKEIQEVLQVVGLSDQQNRRLGTFSGGMKQRILIAQALLGNPQLLILDEPTAGLDPQERIHIRNFISRISANRIVILATHVVQDIAGIAKEIILLGNGKVRMQGTPDEICSSLDGRVWEVRIPAGKASEISEQYLVSNLLEERSGMVQARLISETEPVIPEAAKAVPAPAGIEDVYLSLFDHRKEGRR